ncbi:MAG: hypothetical protein CMM95_01140 [Rickettsiales bacterium]|nr:hypothetical protein [Rickettsiales bacterium]
MNDFHNYLDKGGVIFSLLLVISIIGLTIIIYKFFEIYFFTNVNFKNFFENLEDSKDFSEFKDFINLERSSKKNLLLIDIIQILEKKNDKTDELNLILDVEFNKAQRLLPSLEIIAQVSPLIGLLGTVIGMIDSFNELEIGGSLVDPSILAGGIWTALLTTAMGLIVAIPALISHYFFEKKLSDMQKTMETFLVKLSNKIC